MSVAADLRLASRAKRAGARYALRIVWEARRAKIPASLGFALVEQESGFRNVFGHDPTTSIPEAWKGSRVTRSRYRSYLLRRNAHGMQGVGPCQLTWWATQNAADRLGGCWKPAVNIRVAFHQLAANIAEHGERQGIRAYNGTGAAAERYAVSVMRRRNRWHRTLT